jgi:hypothetical protein
MCLICIMKRTYTEFRDELRQMIKIIIICIMLDIFVCLCIQITITIIVETKE